MRRPRRPSAAPPKLLARARSRERRRRRSGRRRRRVRDCRNGAAREQLQRIGDHRGGTAHPSRGQRRRRPRSTAPIAAAPTTTRARTPCGASADRRQLRLARAAVHDFTCVSSTRARPPRGRYNPNERSIDAGCRCRPSWASERPPAPRPRASSSSSSSSSSLLRPSPSSLPILKQPRSLLWPLARRDERWRNELDRATSTTARASSPVYGCTDSAASNYLSLATDDDDAAPCVAERSTRTPSATALNYELAHDG